MVRVQDLETQITEDKIEQDFSTSRNEHALNVQEKESPLTNPSYLVTILGTTANVGFIHLSVISTNGVASIPTQQCQLVRSTPARWIEIVDIPARQVRRCSLAKERLFPSLIGNVSPHLIAILFSGQQRDEMQPSPDLFPRELAA